MHSFVVITVLILLYSNDTFTRICQGWFTDIGAMVILLRCQWSNPEVWTLNTTAYKKRVPGAYFLKCTYWRCYPLLILYGVITWSDGFLCLGDTISSVITCTLGPLSTDVHKAYWWMTCDMEHIWHVVISLLCATCITLSYLYCILRIIMLFRAIIDSLVVSLNDPWKRCILETKLN